MVDRFLSSVITGGRAPSCVPAPLPLSHQPSVRWTCCYLFSLSWLCLFTALPRRPRSIHRPQHRTATKESSRLVRLTGKLSWRRDETAEWVLISSSFIFSEKHKARLLCMWTFFCCYGDFFSVDFSNTVLTEVMNKARHISSKIISRIVKKKKKDKTLMVLQCRP